MAANLKLVPVEPVQKASQDTGVQQLVPRRFVTVYGVQAKPSTRLVALVAVVHAMVIVWVAGSSLQLEPVKKMQLPMMVSLLKVPALTQESIIEQTAITKSQVKKSQENKPVMEKKKQVAKEKLPVAEQPLKEAPVQETQAKEQPVAQAAETAAAQEQPNVVSSKAVVNETDTKAAEAEPEVEPPKFGAAYLNNPAPEYPQLARRKGEQGRVLLKVLVSENGQPEKVQIDTSSGYGKLDQAALEAVRKWSFIPARRSNQPVSAYVLVPIKFSLNS